MRQKNDASLTFGLIVDRILRYTNYYQTKTLAAIENFTKENNINLITLVTGYLDSPYQWERNQNILFDFIHQQNIDG